ncbi:purine-nucleoside phosphorylase [Desulfonatronum thiosulfatophilum]|uniref:Purine nucleoside phosphorylase n=1 Tax=Desulfonatronum thiosulfatophilum TaxID=617002 RepID=A0A1G6D1W5_9BACT|nr:purine-nucleoside phosphorylase [Desulfonatronum thiosulfatophilum]SDB39157.1 purine-nucleoside phosphorylase [Desulfonatronum thiosulfatophilum]
MNQIDMSRKQPLAQVSAAVESLHSRFESYLHSPVGVILGTGLGQWVESLEGQLCIDYSDIVGFPRSTVRSHAGNLCAGWIDKVPVLALQGRFHLYEGYSPDQVCFGVRTLARFGVKKMIITNAAGALNPLFHPGEMMVISDQINMTGHNPLIGLSYGEPQFPDMSQLYSQKLMKLVHSKALELNYRLQEGVYIGILGPSLETPAETRAYRALGADAIGMSTVMETIAACQMGMEILGLSCLTNKNLPDCMVPTSLEEIIDVGQDIEPRLTALLNVVIPEMHAMK